MGLGECINHGLLHPYPVLHEKAGEVVAQAKATVLLMPNGSDRITPAQPQTVKSEKQVGQIGVKLAAHVQRLGPHHGRAAADRQV